MFQVGRFDPRAPDDTKKTDKHPRSTRKRRAAKNDGRKRKQMSSEHGRGQSEASCNAPAEVREEKLTIGTREDEGKKKKKMYSRRDASITEQNLQDSSELESSESDSSTSLSGQEVDEGETSTLRVIAEEAKPATGSTSLKSSGTDEAFDDFDIDMELLLDEDNKGKLEGHTDDTTTATLTNEVRAALHMSSLPIEQAAASWELAPFLIANLKRDGYDHFFPIQALVIPDVIASQRHGFLRARDVCVASPTGSGKTLAFVLPLLNALADRTVCRLRALVVLPSRDLALQVHKVFERYAHGSNLRVGLAVGQSDFKAEQKALTVGSNTTCLLPSILHAHQRYLFDPGNVHLALEAFPGAGDLEQHSAARRMPLGGVSAVDILVATPGRLVDHMDRTPGFTLQHLHFLVVDEADRLLNQSYHSFISRVMTAVHSRLRTATERSALELSPAGTSCLVDPVTWRRARDEGNDTGSLSPEPTIHQTVQLRKLLFSATMTRDPQKLSSLGLVNPKQFDAHRLQEGTADAPHRYSMPSGLSERTIECTAEQKPLILLALLLEYLEVESEGESNTMVVFTSSLDSTHRLARLLQLLWASVGIGPPTAVVEYSSALSQSQRSALMECCAGSGESTVSVVVCSDGMSRGLDLSVPCIFNYDVPSFAKTYVHRCGRTARAGRKGTAISLLKGGQTRQFAIMRSLIEAPERATEISVKKDLIRTALEHYRTCVRALRGVLQTEEDGNLRKTDAIPSSLFALCSR